jgi:hypothetical protein
MSVQNKTPVLPGFASGCDDVQPQGVGDTGSETLSKTPKKTTVLEPRDAEYDALAAPRNLSNTSLQAIVDAWPDLSDDQRDDILQIAREEL